MSRARTQTETLNRSSVCSQVNSLDKLSHLVCNECVRKLESFHCYALMAQKNQELFNIMYSEKIYREHCTALSSLNTTLYRETPAVPVHPVRSSSSLVQPKAPKSQTKPKPMPALKKQPAHSPSSLSPSPSASSLAQPDAVQRGQKPQTSQQPHQTPATSPQQPVTLLSTEDITIFAYQDLKLGQIIKDLELLKLILRALKWNDVGKTIDAQLERLRNTSFRTVLSSPDLLRDEDLVQLLGPYLDHGSFAPTEQNKPGNDFNSKMMDQNPVTEMEVGVDPELFLPYDDDEPKSVDHEEIKTAPKPNKEVRKTASRTKSTPRKIPASTTVTSAPMIPAGVSPPAAIPIVTNTVATPTRPKTPKGLTVVVHATEDVITVEPLPPVDDGSDKLSAMAAVAAAAEPMPIDPPPPINDTPAAEEIKAPPIAAKPPATASRSSSAREAKAPRTMRKNKIDLTVGPKTRARSVFNAKHKCTVCGKKLTTSGNLKAHMKTHKPKGKFNCDKCGRM